MCSIYISGLNYLVKFPRCSTMELGVYLSTREPREGLAQTRKSLAKPTRQLYILTTGKASDLTVC